MSKVKTVYNGVQPKNKCWEKKSTGCYYLIGDYKVKDSGGCYKLANGRFRTKPKVHWSELQNHYISNNGKNTKYGIYDTNKPPGYFEGSTYSIYDTDNEISINVLKSININEFNIDLYTNQPYIGSNPVVLQKKFSVVDPRKSYSGYGERPYGFQEISKSIINETKQISKEIKPSIPLEEEMIKGINKLSIGIELETSRSNLPQVNLTKYGFFPVYDGSITGNEYISQPINLNGDHDVNGLRNFYHFTSKLQQHSQVDKKNSFHVHVGNLPKKDLKKNTVAIYQLYYLLQREIMEIQPTYKTDFRELMSNARGRGKDYCKPLKSLGIFNKSTIEERFDNIIRWVNDNHSVQRLNSANRFTHIRQGSPKWNWQSRYYQLNFCNLFCSSSGTVEFRVHSGTVDPEKVMNWILIVTGIVNYAIKHADVILTDKKKYEIYDIVTDIYDQKLANKLNTYVAKRKAWFEELYFDNDNGVISEFAQEGVVYKKKKFKASIHRNTSDRSSSSLFMSTVESILDEIDEID